MYLYFHKRFMLKMSRILCFVVLHFTRMEIIASKKNLKNASAFLHKMINMRKYCFNLTIELTFYSFRLFFVALDLHFRLLI